MADDDLRQFMHELLLRFERSTVALERRSDEQIAALREMQSAIRENTAAIREMRKDIRANTRYMLHVIDELRGRGPGPAPA